MKINPRLFWHNVRRIRKEEKGWSQIEFANKIGLGAKNYNNKERGFSLKLPLELAEKIASALDTTVEELCKGEVPENLLINPEIYSFWQAVKVRREKLGLSQKNIAELLNMSTQNYQAKESGKATRLPPALAEKIANVLGCTVEDLRQNKPIRTLVGHQEEKIDSQLGKTELTFPYPQEIVYWMNTREGAAEVIEAYKSYLQKKLNKIF